MKNYCSNLAELNLLLRNEPNLKAKLRKEVLMLPSSRYRHRFAFAYTVHDMTKVDDSGFITGEMMAKEFSPRDSYMKVGKAPTGWAKQIVKNKRRDKAIKLRRYYIIHNLSKNGSYFFGEKKISDVARTLDSLIRDLVLTLEGSSKGDLPHNLQKLKKSAYREKCIQEIINWRINQDLHKINIPCSHQHLTQESIRKRIEKGNLLMRISEKFAS